jgi:hypothetical protein
MGNLSGLLRVGKAVVNTDDKHMLLLFLHASRIPSLLHTSRCYLFYRFTVLPSSKWSDNNVLSLALADHKAMAPIATNTQTDFFANIVCFILLLSINVLSSGEKQPIESNELSEKQKPFEEQAKAVQPRRFIPSAGNIAANGRVSAKRRLAHPLRRADRHPV